MDWSSDHGDWFYIIDMATINPQNFTKGGLNKKCGLLSAIDGINYSENA